MIPSLKEKWPYLPNHLSELVSEKFLSVVIAGMSDRLDVPVVLVEKINNKPNFIFPINDGKLHKYPKFCERIHELGGEQICRRDSSERATCLLNNIKNECGDDSIERCHFGLTVYSEIISIWGIPLAVCSTGKFVLSNSDCDIVENKLNTLLPKFLPKENKISFDEIISELLSLAKKTKRNNIYYNNFKERFVEQINILNVMLRSSLVQRRNEKEIELRNGIVKSFSKPIDVTNPETINDILEHAIGILLNALPVKYIALFLAQETNDMVLPLAQQVGLAKEKVSSVHFNWNKGGLPAVDAATQKFGILTSDNPEFKKIIIKGVKGIGKENYQNAICLLPIGRSYRGVLLVGELEASLTKYLAENPSDRKDFYHIFETAGYLLVSYSVARQAEKASIRHDRQRDTMNALTAHSMLASMDKLLSAGEMIEYQTNRLWEGMETSKPKLSYAVEDLTRLITLLQVNVNLVMNQPATAVIGDMDKTEMTLESVNLSVILYNVIDTFEEKLLAKGIKWEIDNNVNDLPLVNGDRYMLHLLFSNLIDNAYKYSKKNTTLRIFAPDTFNTLLYDTVTIFIRNLGWGIPDNELDAIFEQGFQSDSVEKATRRGVGLGLYQAQKFIELHHGTIKASSRPLQPTSSLRNHIVTLSISLPKDY